MPTVSDVLNATEKFPAPATEDQFRATCSVCATDQGLNEATRHDEEDRSDYLCVRGCGVLVSVVPAADIPEFGGMVEPDWEWGVIGTLARAVRFIDPPGKRGTIVIDVRPDQRR